MDISKIKLIYTDIPGTGKEIHADFNQEFKVIDCHQEQLITYTSLDSPTWLVSERWTQFPPGNWHELIEAVFTELVNLWNEKYHHTE